MERRSLGLFLSRKTGWPGCVRDRRVVGFVALWCLIALVATPRATWGLFATRAPVLVAEPEPVKPRLIDEPKSATRALPREPRSLEAASKWSVPATPLDEEEAARHLARALHRVVGSRASETAVSVLWAHWAHETGRGKRMLGHNFAGLKGDGTQGGALVWTREKTGARKKLVRRTFRVYDSPEEGALDYVTLLLTRYRGTLSAAREGRTADFVHVLRARAYYTDEHKVYERAISRLARECVQRSLARRALEAERKSAICSCHADETGSSVREKSSVPESTEPQPADSSSMTTGIRLSVTS